MGGQLACAKGYSGTSMDKPRRYYTKSGMDRSRQGSTNNRKNRPHPCDILVNGRDLSRASHEEAVEAFRTAKEPIVVEVLRRVANGHGPSGSPAPGPTPRGGMKPPPPPPGAPPPGVSPPGSPLVPMVTVATQTDELIEDDPLFYGMYALNGNGHLIQPTSRMPMALSQHFEGGLTDIELAAANGLHVYELDETFEDERAFEMEYEEVTLERTNTEEKVGLTLCYGSADDEITDIFISEVESDSIAGRDGRIHEGDQILQINGVDVHSREQAIRLFAENREDITLLLARPQMMDDGFLDENHLLDGFGVDVFDASSGTPIDFLSHGVDEEGGTTDTATTENSARHDKDSGVGRTDESCKNDESSEQELMEGECGSPGSAGSHSHKGTPRAGGSDQHMCNLSNDSFTSTEPEAGEEGAPPPREDQCEQFRADLQSRARENNKTGSGNNHVDAPISGLIGNAGIQTDSSSGGDIMTSQYIHNDNNNGGGLGVGVLPLGRKDSQSSIEREILQLNKEMEMIQMECQEIVEAHSQRQVTNQGQGRKGQAGGAGSPQGQSEGQAFRSPRLVPRMGTRLDYMKQMLAAQEAAQVQQNYNNLAHAQHVTGSSGFMTGSDHHVHPTWPPPPPIDSSSPLKPKEVQQLTGVPLHSQVGPSHTGQGPDERDTSSAYNTGDSCRSTPLTLELSSAPVVNGHKVGGGSSLLSLSLPHVRPSYSDSEKMTQTGPASGGAVSNGGLPVNGGGGGTKGASRDWNSDGSESKKLKQFLPPGGQGQHHHHHHHHRQGNSPTSTVTPPPYHSHQTGTGNNHLGGFLSKSVSNGSFSEKTSQTPNGDLSQTENADSLQELYAQYADVMYTNRANLEHTIMVQQKLFQQQLMQRSAHARLQGEIPVPEGSVGSGTGSGEIPPLATTSVGGLPLPSGSGTAGAQGSHMEWVVKRRADGSRYITRRPIRNKILKERAKKIQEERCGMTTDDDAVSEMKVGRYWTKDERKKHLEKMREHKKRKQEMLRTRMETVKENDEEKRKEPNIVELSHRKMMKHKNKRVFDDFTTVQEMMAHGSREPQVNQKGYNPLLSVTTV